MLKPGSRWLSKKWNSWRWQLSNKSKSIGLASALRIKHRFRSWLHYTTILSNENESHQKNFNPSSVVWSKNYYWKIPKIISSLTSSKDAVDSGVGYGGKPRSITWALNVTNLPDSSRSSTLHRYRLSSARPSLSRFFISFLFVYLFCRIPSHNDKYNLIFILYLHEPRICNNIGELFSLR